MSQAPQQSAPPAGQSDDPLASLHRMSTTAGVASQQYVAVNTTAVVAALLGVASGLTVFSQLMLVIPVAGIVCAILAWRQISDSNGTETGKLFAAAGLLLSLLVGGGAFARQLAASAHARADGRAMAAVIAKINDDIRAGKLSDAYQRFSVPFRTRIPEDVFVTRWKQVQDPNAYGKLLSMTWNNVPPQYETAEGGDVTFAVIYVATAFERTDPRYTFVFRKVGDQWQLENIAELFPLERKPAPNK